MKTHQVTATEFRTGKRTVASWKNGSLCGHCNMTYVCTYIEEYNILDIFFDIETYNDVCNIWKVQEAKRQVIGVTGEDEAVSQSERIITESINRLQAAIAIVAEKHNETHKDRFEPVFTGPLGEIQEVMES